MAKKVVEVKHAKIPKEPPRGFGHEGKFSDLSADVQEDLQKQWDAMDAADQQDFADESAAKYAGA